MNLDTLLKFLPTVITGIAGYIGGVLSDPLKIAIATRQRIREVENGLIAEITNTYEHYQMALLMPPSAQQFRLLQKQLRIDCYKAALQERSPPLLARDCDWECRCSCSLRKCRRCFFQ